MSQVEFESRNACHFKINLETGRGRILVKPSQSVGRKVSADDGMAERLLSLEIAG